jgi:hypothetical protein
VARQRCVTCGQRFEAPRRRAYCSRGCWPSEPRIAGLAELREEFLAAIERHGATFNDQLALDRLDVALAQTNGYGP